MTLLTPNMASRPAGFKVEHQGFKSRIDKKLWIGPNQTAWIEETSSIPMSSMTMICGKCLAEGHLTYACPNEPKCRKYLQEGHVGRQCSRCTHCRKYGHEYRDCPKRKEDEEREGKSRERQQQRNGRDRRDRDSDSPEDDGELKDNSGHGDDENDEDEDEEDDEDTQEENKEENGSKYGEQDDESEEDGREENIDKPADKQETMRDMYTIEEGIPNLIIDESETKTQKRKKHRKPPPPPLPGKTNSLQKMMQDVTDVNQNEKTLYSLTEKDVEELGNIPTSDDAWMMEETNGTQKSWETQMTKSQRRTRKKENNTKHGEPSSSSTDSAKSPEQKKSKLDTKTQPKPQRTKQRNIVSEKLQQLKSRFEKHQTTPNPRRKQYGPTTKASVPEFSTD